MFGRIDFKTMRNMTLWSTLLALLLAACSAPSGGGQRDGELASPEEVAAVSLPALGEGLNTTPTAWWWYYGQTAAQVASLINTNNGRLVSLQVESASPLRFTVAMVKNTGTYAKTWWWYHSLTAAQLSSLVTDLNGRIVDIDVYVENGSTRFAAILISNTGADAKAWWWYHGMTTAQIATLVTQNNARLIDLHSYTSGGSTLYAVVMIKNTGADARSWWWYHGVSGSTVSNLLQQNHAFLTSIEHANSTGTTFNVVMQQPEGAYWWWYYGATAAQIEALAAQNGARILDVKSYFVNGSRFFVAIMLNNSNAATTRVGQILRNGTDGVSGFHLKRVGSSVEASLQPDFAFSPASSIKALIGVHAMRQIEPAGGLELTSLINTVAAGAGSCPSGTVTGSEQMGTALSQMLVNSDNQRTRAFIDRFGFNAIQQTAQSIGMTSTSLVVYPGCNITNRWSLTDATRLYEGVMNGSLLNATSRAALWARMPANGGDFTSIVTAVNAIIDAEAPAFALSAARITQFKNRFRTHYKAGGDDWNSLQYRAIAGIAEVPACSGATIAARNYFWGLFIHGGSSPGGDNTFWTARAEPLREPLRSALSTWAACSP